MWSVRWLLFPALLTQICALMNEKPTVSNSEDNRPFAVLLKVVGRGIFGPQRQGTGWLISHWGELFVVTAAHTFGKLLDEGASVHVFGAAPEPYRGAHQLYRLRRSVLDIRNNGLDDIALAAADGYENLASVAFMNADAESIPNDVALVHLTGDNRRLLAGTRPLSLGQLSTDVNQLAKNTQLRLFGCASPLESQDINYYVINPEDCLLSSNETKAFCFKSKSGYEQPIKGDSGAAVICQDNTSKYGDVQVCGMLFARTNTRAGIALSIAHYGRFIQRTTERMYIVS